MDVRARLLFLRVIGLGVTGLALPTITVAQYNFQLKVERIWTQDEGGNDKTTFSRSRLSPLPLAGQIV